MDKFYNAFFAGSGYTLYMRLAFIHTCILCVFLFLLPAVSAQAQFSLTAMPQNKPHAAISLQASQAAAVPGAAFTLAITQIIDPGWHTYWKNPGDSGAATAFNLDLPQGISHDDILWPAPKRISYQTLMNYGYENRAVFLTDVHVPLDYTKADLTIDLQASWLVCHDICIPERGRFSLTLPVSEQAQASDPAFFKNARTRIPQKTDMPATYHEDAGRLVVTLPDVRDIQDAAFFPEVEGLIENAAAQEIHETPAGLEIQVPRGRRNLSEIDGLPFVLVSSAGTYQITATPRPDTGGMIPVTFSKSAGGFGYHLLLALVGGLILNLMPCVFPVLSLKALGLVQMSSKARREAVMHGIAYTGGILVSFALFAFTILAFRSTGTALGWGFHLQNPVNILVLAFFIFLIGLNLSGVYIIGGKFMNWGGKLAARTNLSGSFFTGVLAAVVATPCTAPFMAGAIAYAALQPPVQAVTIFLGVGFGLALPYLLLTLVPGFQKLMPRPGAWMERFKEFLAFPMYLTVLWLLWVLAQQAGMAAVFLAMAGLLAVTFIFWLLKNRSGKILTVSAIVIIAISVYLLPHDRLEGDNARHYSAAELEKALSTNHPVLVNMTAAWCITCKINEKTTLTTDHAKSLFEKYDVAFITGDWTNEDPAITEYLTRFGRNGVPLYVFYPAPEGGVRPEPVILPQILTPGIIENVLGH